MGEMRDEPMGKGKTRSPKSKAAAPGGLSGLSRVTLLLEAGQRLGLVLKSGDNV
jgi:hypothetical protein